jgi:hypothetical protein
MSSSTTNTGLEANRTQTDETINGLRIFQIPKMTRREASVRLCEMTVNNIFHKQASHKQSSHKQASHKQAWNEWYWVTE